MATDSFFNEETKKRIRDEAAKNTSGIGAALAPAPEKQGLPSKPTEFAPIKTATGAGDLAAKIGEQRKAIVPGASAPSMAATDIDRAKVQDVKAGTVSGAQIDPTQQAQFRGQQRTLAQTLADQAAGIGGPSVAEMQLKEATDRNIGQALALQAGATGPQAAAARRQAVSQTAQTGQEAARQAAILRAQEQQQARQQLGEVVGAGRAADIGLATSQAGLEQQAAIKNVDTQLSASLANQGVDLEVLKSNAAAGNAAARANLEAELSKMGMDNQMIQAYLSAETGLTIAAQDAINTAELQAQQLTAKAESDYNAGLISLESLKAQRDIAAQNVKAAKDAAKIKAQGDVTAGGLGALATLGAAGIAAFSDINLKKNIVKKGIGSALNDKYKKNEGSKDRLTAFLDSLDAYDYDYKDEKHGKGRQTSVMAQDLEKSEIGKKAIVEAPEGKMVDYGKILPEILASAVQSHKRISSLEEALKAKKKKGNK